MSKRSFSMIETLICLGLVALLLSSLTFWYRSLTSQKEIFNQLKGPLMEERYAGQRLQNIFPTVEAPFFTTSDRSLVFVFDRGTFIEPKLSGKVLGKLYFNETTQTLCLGIWPKPTKENIERSLTQHFVLLDGVSSCHFAFYSPPDLSKQPVDPETVGTPRPQDKWQDRWLPQYTSIPALVKIVITRTPQKGIDNHTFEYLFDLPIEIQYCKEAV